MTPQELAEYRRKIADPEYQARAIDALAGVISPHIDLDISRGMTLHEAERLLDAPYCSFRHYIDRGGER